MKHHVWGDRSLSHLEGIHPDLRRIADLALKLSPLDFMVTDGVRTIEEQKDNIAKGVSWTMKSRHLTGHALDFVPWVDGKVRWKEWHYFEAIADAFKKAAKQLGIRIVWGGDWKKTKDGPHIELDARDYPA